MLGMLEMNSLWLWIYLHLLTVYLPSSIFVVGISFPYSMGIYFVRDHLSRLWNWGQVGRTGFFVSSHVLCVLHVMQVSPSSTKIGTGKGERSIVFTYQYPGVLAALTIRGTMFSINYSSYLSRHRLSLPSTPSVYHLPCVSIGFVWRKQPYTISHI